jgi:hypothetical protein
MMADAAALCAPGSLANTRLTVVFGTGRWAASPSGAREARTRPGARVAPGNDEAAEAMLGSGIFGLLDPVDRPLDSTEFKNVIARVAQIEELIVERHRRVTPRVLESTGAPTS